MKGRKIILIGRSKTEDTGSERIRQTLAATCPCLDVVELYHRSNLIDEVAKFQPELILLDLCEDTENSRNTIQTIRQQFCDLPVFALIGGYSFEFEREMLRLGITAVFPREIETESLVLNIKTVLGDMC